MMAKKCACSQCDLRLLFDIIYGLPFALLAILGWSIWQFRIRKSIGTSYEIYSEYTLLCPQMLDEFFVVISLPTRW
jgi:hypothetical protein